MVLALGASSTWANTSEENEHSIITSEREHRQFKGIKLENGLTVLLISDKEATKALAGLAVPVGGMQDPADQAGLAHYHEHMVLLGSHKYPEPDGFSTFLSKHSGQHNASTSLTQTTYYLEVDHSAFPEAVDRLASALAEPTFDPLYADKERNAVNAELTMARANDGFRIGQVDAETMNPVHPAAHFFGGNLETLSDKPGSILHQELLDFYQRYYSANIMVGLLYSSDSLDNLSQLAQETFARIPNRQITVPETEVPAVTPEQTGVIIHYVPVKPYNQLLIRFTLPYRQQTLTEKNDLFIGYLLENRGPDGLYDQLQKKGWIESFSAYSNQRRFGNEDVFNISVLLTQTGAQHRDEIIQQIFTYLELIKEKGIQRHYFDELAKILKIDFQYPDSRFDMGYAQRLLNRMLDVPLEHIMDAPYLLGDFNPQVITDRLSLMTAENARIWYISPEEQHDKEAYFVQAPYSVEKLSEQQKALWTIDSPLATQLQLPSSNPYIVDDLHIVTHAAQHDELPHKVLDEPGLRVFVRASEYFSDEPKSSITLRLHNSTALLTLQNQIEFALLDYLVGLKQAELIYQVSVGGVSIESFPEQGLALTLQGYSQHIPTLLKKVFNNYQSLTITDNELAQAKQWYFRQLGMGENVRAFEQAIQPATSLGIIPYYERDDRRAALSSITVENVLQYRDKILQHSAVDLFAWGNTTSEEMVNLAKDVRLQLVSVGNTFNYGRKLVATKQVMMTAINQPSRSSDSALAQFFLDRGDEISSDAHSRVLSTIIGPWFYQSLRTEQQLGYAVFAQSWRISHYHGLAFILQSNHASPELLYQHYQTFFQSVPEKLAELTSEQIEQYKRSVLNKLEEKPQNIKQEVMPYINAFRQGRLDFNYRQRLVESITALTQADLMDYFQRNVLQGKGINFTSQVLGADAKEGAYQSIPEEKVYPNASTLQQAFIWQQN